MMTDPLVPPIGVVPLQPQHWPEVRRIYAEGLATGVATFETEVPTWERWHATHLPHCRLVARAAGAVVGWAALSPVSTRAVYAGVAEVSIYIAATERSQGIGTRLLRALVLASEAAGIWTLQATIFAENQQSVRLHHRCGFRTVGRRNRLGQRDGTWHDVLLLERRSGVVGMG